MPLAMMMICRTFISQTSNSSSRPFFPPCRNWPIYDIFLMFYIQWIILPMHCNDKSGWVRSRADLLPRVDLTFSGSLSPSAVTPQDIARHFVNPEYLLPKIFQNIIKPLIPSAVMPQDIAHHSKYLLFKVLETFQRFSCFHYLCKTQLIKTYFTFTVWLSWSWLLTFLFLESIFHSQDHWTKNYSYQII